MIFSGVFLTLHYDHMCSETHFTQETSHFHPTTGSFNKTVTRNLLLTDPKKNQNVAMCLLARVGWITPAAKEAAARRMMAMRMEEEMRRDGGAPWMASLAGPGWAKRGGLCDFTTVFS